MQLPFTLEQFLDVFPGYSHGLRPSVPPLGPGTVRGAGHRYQRSPRGAQLAAALLLLGLLQAAPLCAQRTTTVYLVRHAEIDPTRPEYPLSAIGRARAELLARTVELVPFTHVFSSHTTRARQMVEPVAVSRGLVVTQHPRPGVQADGRVVSDTTPSRLAVTPLVEAIRAVPPGSNVLVGVNSENLYAILHGLGVPVAAECPPGQACVPCLTRACVPATLDHLWILVRGAGPHPGTLIQLRFGAFQ
ncbi:MAG: histidine phosphatase family protein [Gemmatimonadales bacterium]